MDVLAVIAALEALLIIVLLAVMASDRHAAAAAWRRIAEARREDAGYGRRTPPDEYGAA